MSLQMLWYNVYRMIGRFRTGLDTVLGYSITGRIPPCFPYTILYHPIPSYTYPILPYDSLYYPVLSYAPLLGQLPAGNGSIMTLD